MDDLNIEGFPCDLCAAPADWMTPGRCSECAEYDLETTEEFTLSYRTTKCIVCADRTREDGRPFCSECSFDGRVFFHVWDTATDPVTHDEILPYTAGWYLVLVRAAELSRGDNPVTLGQPLRDLVRTIGSE